MGSKNGLYTFSVYEDNAICVHGSLAFCELQYR